MQLSIKGNNLTENFAKWLLEIIKIELKQKIDKRKLESWEKYFRENLHIVIPIDLIIKKSIDNLIYKFTDENEILICLNDKEYIVANYKLITICKMINFGNVDHNGYPVFSDIFNQVASKVDNYVILYNLMSDED